MASVKLLHPHKSDLVICPNCGEVQPEPPLTPYQRPTQLASPNVYERHLGRIAIFELTTGTRVQGKILAVSDEWIDTDNGAVKIEHIVHAKWVSEDEARIIRGGPIRGY